MSQIYVPKPDAALVRYLVRDLDKAAAFYTEYLGFKLTQRSGPILVVTRGDLNLLFSGPGSSGAKDTPDGRTQETGGWNRIMLYVDNIEASIATLKRAGAKFRNDLMEGPGGKQILVEDPDGNPIELHEAPKR